MKNNANRIQPELTQQRGVFTISLDFELYWGFVGERSVKQYTENLLGVYSAIPAILKIFNEYNIHATWATIGFLFFDTFESLLKSTPSRIPKYIDSELSPYKYIASALHTNEDELIHFAPSLIKTVSSSANQEIGSHTFSHYYCLEKGQDLAAFKADLVAAMSIAKKNKLKITSLVFPRNQYNPEYLSVCKELGVVAFRGNESFWIYKAADNNNNSLIRRAFRLADTYINISGQNTYSQTVLSRKFPFNIPSSRFLRPYSKRLKYLEPYKLRRIKSGLTYAAKSRQVYHLWWHPHNFGSNLDKNMHFLKKVLNHYSILNKTHGMESLNMSELSDRLFIERSRNVYPRH